MKEEIKLTEAQYEQCFERAFGVNIKETKQRNKEILIRNFFEIIFLISCIVLGLIVRTG